MSHKTICLLFLILAGCANTIERLKNIGMSPELNEIPVYQEESINKKDHINHKKHHNNSLWQAGSKHFFKDNRAGRIGDIIKVNIKIADNAKLENESTRSRKTTENLPIPKIPVVNQALSAISPDKNNLLDMKGHNSNLGSGTIDRNEKINTQIAASVIKVLPNGNFVIRGTQEIKVNFEMRQIYIGGIVRQEDISVDNTVDSSKVAELRVSYGGKGHISDVQQPRLGTQLIDILSPF